MFSRSVESVTWSSCMLCLSLEGNFSDKPKDGIHISQNVHLFYQRLDIQCAPFFTGQGFKGQCCLTSSRALDWRSSFMKESEMKTENRIKLETKQ